MTAQELTEALNLEALCLPDPDREVRGGYAGDLLSWVMGNAQPDDVWVTIMSNNNVVAVASLADTALVVLSENVRPDPGVLELAEQKDVNLACSPESTFTLCARIAALL